MEKHPFHLKTPDFQKSPEVNAAVKRGERLAAARNKEFRTSNQEGPLERERVPNNPTERIETYMNRLEAILLHPDEKKRERTLDGHPFGSKQSLREKIHDELIIKKENFPESYFELQKRVARERGQAIDEIPKNVREQMMDTAIRDQEASLNEWIDYLTSDDAVYPSWFKYYAFTQITKLSQYDKERGEFKKRTDSTVAPFPDVYREPLAKIADLYERVKNNNKNSEARKDFDKKFPALYAELISKSLADSIENREQIKGQWVKYKKGNQEDAEKLYESLQDKGTGWCTAGSSTAEQQIESGDFYVYYTENTHGKPVNPRLAIRMDGTDKIGEVRGILPQQNVEPILQKTLDEKLNEFGSEADTYRKKSADMKQLTAIEQKVNNEKPLTKDDLLFLYEVDSTIEGFGYKKDPRIEELRNQRNLDEDMLVIFECTKDQIAHVPSEIGQTTKAYVGQLEPGIFDLVQGYDIKHIFTSFPEGKILRQRIESGGMNARQLEDAFESKGIKISDPAKGMMRNKDFTTDEQREQIDLVRLSIGDLGFRRGATTDQIYNRAEELGLKLCPPDTGHQYRLRYMDQSIDNWIYVGMKEIADPGCHPFAFRVGRGGEEIQLDRYPMGPNYQWGSSDYQFLFRLQKAVSEK